MQPTQIKRVRDAQAYIGQLYPNDDRDAAYIYSYASRHLGYLSKALTQKLNPEIDFIRVFSWMLALANKLEVDVEDAIVSRYPGICPYCLEPNCRCVFTKKRPASGIPAYKIPEELGYQAELQRRTPRSLQECASLISAIYPNNVTTWEAIGAWKHTSKFSEELAEVQEAYSKYYARTKPLSAVAEEFADIFAWLLTAWSIVVTNKTADEAFIAYYLHGCPVCGRNASCTCATFADLSANLVDPEQLRRVAEIFRTIVAATNRGDADVEDVLRSLETAAATQSEPVARAAVVQAQSKVAQIEETLDRGAKAAENVQGLIGTFNKAMEVLGFLQ